MLQETFCQKSEAMVLWRQSCGALRSIVVLDVRIQRAKVGVRVRCASNGMLFKHAFLWSLCSLVLCQ